MLTECLRQGCQQRAQCDATIKDVSELPECCKQWPKKPQVSMDAESESNGASRAQLTLTKKGLRLATVSKPL